MAGPPRPQAQTFAASSDGSAPLPLFSAAVARSLAHDLQMEEDIARDLALARELAMSDDDEGIHDPLPFAPTSPRDEGWSVVPRSRKRRLPLSPRSMEAIRPWDSPPSVDARERSKKSTSLVLTPSPPSVVDPESLGGGVAVNVVEDLGSSATVPSVEEHDHLSLVDVPVLPSLPIVGGEVSSVPVVGVPLSVVPELPSASVDSVEPPGIPGLLSESPSSADVGHVNRPRPVPRLRARLQSPPSVAALGSLDPPPSVSGRERSPIHSTPTVLSPCPPSVVAEDIVPTDPVSPAGEVVAEESSDKVPELSSASVSPVDNLPSVSSVPVLSPAGAFLPRKEDRLPRSGVGRDRSPRHRKHERPTSIPLVGRPALPGALASSPGSPSPASSSSQSPRHIPQDHPSEDFVGLSPPDLTRDFIPADLVEDFPPLNQPPSGKTKNPRVCHPSTSHNKGGSSRPPPKQRGGLRKMGKKGKRK